MLRCGDGSLYTGIATNVLRRITEHEAGPKGSRYLRGRGPLQLVWQAEVGDRALATRVELKIKRLDRHDKERLILAPERLEALLDPLIAVRETEPPGGPVAICES